MKSEKHPARCCQARPKQAGRRKIQPWVKYLKRIFPRADSARHSSKQPSGGRCLAFTLVELLVVIAIVAILAALLFPAIGGLKKQLAATKCTANLKTVSAILLAYATDQGITIAAYDGGQAWMNPLVNYAGWTPAAAAKVLYCPANPNETLWLKPSSGKGGCNYSLVYRPFGFGTVVSGSDSFRVSLVASPSKLVLISDGCLPFTSGTNKISNYRIDSGEIQTVPKTPANFFHNGGINIAFFDGSVRYSKTNELDPLWWSSTYQK